MLNRFLGLVLLLASVSAAAEDSGAPDGRLTLVFGPYVYHYHDNADHNDLPWLTGFEWGPDNWWVDLGAVYFRNSFYQDSAYVYLGKRWFWKKKDDGVYLKLTGGPLWGYRGEFEDKVPFNHKGLGWAIIPGIGYQFKAVDAQLVLLGGAALMVTFGLDLYK